MKVFHHISALISASFLLLISPLETIQGSYVNGGLWFELSNGDTVELVDLPQSIQYGSEEHLDEDKDYGLKTSISNNYYPFSFKYFLQSQNRLISNQWQVHQTIATQPAILSLFQTVRSVYSNKGIPDQFV